MTEEQIKEVYGQDVEKLREAINSLDFKTDRTAEEDKLLETLKVYRFKYHKNDKLAYYDVFEMTTLFDFKTVGRH